MHFRNGEDINISQTKVSLHEDCALAVAESVKILKQTSPTYVAILNKWQKTIENSRIIDITYLVDTKKKPVD